MVTSRDVARLAEVSQATVSRAMSKPSSVKPSTLERIRLAMRDLGYTPNAAAQAMKTGHTNTVGVVVADIKNPFYPEILDALTNTFYAAGKRVIVWNSDGYHDKNALEALAQGTIEGLVFTTIFEKSAELTESIKAGFPIVMVNRYVDGLSTDQVRSQNTEGGSLVADYFLDHGKSRIACIFGPVKTTTSSERLRGFLDRLATRGVQVEPEYLVQGEFSHQSGLESMRHLLDLPEPPDAVFCGNDVMAFGALDLAKRQGIAVPGKVWVVGFDDVEMSSWDSFRLTTVRQDSQAMAREAARLLLKRIEDPSRPREDICFPCALVIRESTAGSSAQQ
jgi:LacI family transcriptional regulator